MKASIKKQFQKIADSGITIDRAYYDISDEFAYKVFDLYDPADLYMYLTQKERNLAYKDLQGINANNKQAQLEWMKKAIWRIAKNKAWDDLYELEESKMSDKAQIKEAKSSYYKKVITAFDAATDLASSSNFIIGAAGTDEILQILKKSVDAAKYLIEFTRSVVLQSDDDLTEDPSLSKAIRLCSVAMNSLELLESADVSGTKVNESSEIFIDPYESEYLPEYMLTSSCKVNESIKEEIEPLPDDLDDDPDAIMSLNSEGMPIKFNNTPLELDPFAVKLFRNNSELVDPPETFNAVNSTEKTDDEEIADVVSTEVGTEVSSDGEGSAETVMSDDLTAQSADDILDAVIDSLADVDTNKEKDETLLNPAVELPSNDFDVFANESKMPTAKVVAKDVSPVLPPQFSETEAKRANANIAENPGNNLKMLSFLTQDW